MEAENKSTAEQLLQDLGKKIDALIEKGKKKAEEIDVDEHVEELKDGINTLSQEFEYFIENNKEQFQEVGSHLEKAIHEMKNVVENIFSKKN